MAISLDSLAAEVDALRALNGRDAAGLTSTEFDDFRHGLGQIKRAYDAIASSMAFELARRSAPELGAGGLARRDGFSNAQQSLGNTLGITPGQAGKFIDAGRALAPAPAEEFSEAPDAPRYPRIAEALERSLIGADAAAIMTCTLDAVARSYALESDPGELGEALVRELKELERRLVDKVGTLTLSELRKVCDRERAWRFPKELAAKEQLHRENRKLFFQEDGEGMTVMTARMDAASAAPIKAFIDAQTRWALQRRRSVKDGGEGVDDPRTAGQIRIDAMAALAHHGLGCDASASGVKTTVVIRINERDLKDDLATGECDQISGPISVGTLRAMAVDAGVIPVVLGGASLPLDVGRLNRLFTPTQRLAIVERDGGCSWCHAPPSFCQTHHIEWWGRDGGKTDLSNGVLLCTRCHHRVHNDGWVVEVDGDDVRITKPGTGVRRLGGRAHLELDRATSQ